MMKQGEVFVISEDDILKPSPSGTGKAAPSTRSGETAARPSALRSTAVSLPSRARDRSSGVPSPAVASTLSLWVWGLGQFYNGDRKMGILFFLCQLQVIAVHYMLYEIWAGVRQAAQLFFVSESELLLYIAAADFCLIFFMAFNVAQAYRGAESRGGEFDGIHLPIVSGLASTLVPGWGQVLNGQLGKATLFLSAFLLQAYLVVGYLYSPFYRIVMELDPEQILLKNAISAGMVLLFGTALCWLISAYDAFLVARYTRRLAQ
jgi:hypothetical protein